MQSFIVEGKHRACVSHKLGHEVKVIEFRTVDRRERNTEIYRKEKKIHNFDYGFSQSTSDFSHYEGQNHKKLPLHSCRGESSNLVLCRQTMILSIGRIFVRMSNPLSSVWIFTRVNSPSFTFSLNQ